MTTALVILAPQLQQISQNEKKRRSCGAQWKGKKRMQRRLCTTRTKAGALTMRAPLEFPRHSPVGRPCDWTQTRGKVVMPLPSGEQRANRTDGNCSTSRTRSRNVSHDQDVDASRHNSSILFPFSSRRHSPSASFTGLVFLYDDAVLRLDFWLLGPFRSVRTIFETGFRGSRTCRQLPGCVCLRHERSRRGTPSRL